MHLSLGLSLGLSRGLSLALGAGVWGRFPLRLKSTGGPRPSAPLGSRILTNPEDVFKHNMWDHMLWTEEENEEARQKAEENSSELIPLKEQGKYDTDACRYWDGFYETHQDKFFKDRKWLFLEFPELLPAGTESAGTESVGTNGCQGGLKASHPHPSGHGRDMETRPHPCSVPAHRHADATDLQHSCCGDGVESGVPGQRSNTLPGQQSNPLPGQQSNTLPGQQSNPLPGQQSNPLPGQQSNTFPGQHATFRILEVGCGVGNSVFPIVTSIKEKGAFLYCCDFSPRAIQMVKDHPGYERSVCHAFVHDICEEEEETPGRVPFPPRSLDVILAIFVLSSIHPERVQSVVTRLSGYLKHGGIFLFRDYGRYDLSQLRFKKGQCLSENFYTRQDGTCVYFFTKDEVCSLFSNAGLEEIQNLEDRRLQVNRGKKVVMHRVWMQGKFRKPHLPC